MRCSRHVLSRGSPGVDQGHAGEIISQLTWDCLSFPTDALEVAGEKGVWASLLRLLLLCDLALDTSKNWMDGNGANKMVQSGYNYNCFHKSLPHRP